MFKKSEEQEWTRFRGALSKDREEASPVPAAADAADATTGSTAGPPVTGPTPSSATSPSLRAAADGTRLARIFEGFRGPVKWRGWVPSARDR